MRRGCHCFWLFLVGEKEIREQCFVRWDGEEEIVFDCFVWWKGDKRTMFCSVRWKRWLLCSVRWRRWLLCLVRMRECNFIYRVETMFTQIRDTYFRQRQKITLARDKLIHWYTPQKTSRSDKSAQDITINQECPWHTDTKECPVTWKRNWYNDIHWQKECPVTVQLQPQYFGMRWTFFNLT